MIMVSRCSATALWEVFVIGSLIFALGEVDLACVANARLALWSLSTLNPLQGGPAQRALSSVQVSLL